MDTQLVQCQSWCMQNCRSTGRAFFEHENKFELLATDDNANRDVHFPKIVINRYVGKSQAKKAKAQGKSAEDKEIDKLVREVPSNRVKVRIGKKLLANLDSLDQKMCDGESLRWA